MKSLLCGLLLLPLTLSTAGTQAEEPKAEKNEKAETAAKVPDQETLEREFAEKLSGVVFAGSFSVTKDGEEKPAQMEKYTISKVTKFKDDLWVFSARMQYGKTDITLPLTLQVQWAGDTPVITLTKLTIPGVGTFTSRVLIYGDRYAGTWQHDKIGGHLWGRLEKPEKAEAK